jgi:hypothetical protein
MLRRYANNEEKQITIREHERFRCAAVAFERATCNGAQHEEARCMTNIAK